MRQRRCGWSIRMASPWVSPKRRLGTELGLFGLRAGSGCTSGSGKGWGEGVSKERLMTQGEEGRT